MGVGHRILLGLAAAERRLGHVVLVVGHACDERHVGRWNHARGHVTQFYLGPFRDPNPKLARALGADSGCDTVGDARQGPGLVRFLGRLAAEDALSRTILYNINPADNALFAATSRRVGCPTAATGSTASLRPCATRTPATPSAGGADDVMRMVDALERAELHWRAIGGITRLVEARPELAAALPDDVRVALARSQA